MGFRRVASAVGLALAIVASGQAVAAAGSPGSSTLLSLGDSLAAGYQPAHDNLSAGDTNQGYADQLAQMLPNVQLQKFGCSGETTTSMLTGGKCTYPGASSQLDAAVKYLNAHRGQVKIVTIDIGANDVQKCAAGGSIDIPCAVQGVATLAQNLPVILSTLRAAAGPDVTIVGMNYYNPFLASYLKGSDGVFLAAGTSLAEYVVNTIEETDYRAIEARVADVSGAFQSYDFFTMKDLPGVGPVPVNVYNICTLTYMCALGDIHANVSGYKVIADAFVAALRPVPVPA